MNVAPQLSDRTRVHGRVHAREVLIAPLSGRRCVAHRCWGRVAGQRFDESEALPFELTLTGGRRARIDERSRLEVAFHEGDGDLRFRSALFHPWAMPLFGRVLRSGCLPERLAAFLRARGIEAPGAGAIYELALEPGCGALVEARVDEPRTRGYRDARPVLMLRETEAGDPVIIRGRDAPPGT